jgi:phage terminase large subunit
MKLPRSAQKFLSGTYRYRCLYGGRGSAKSQTIATLLLLRGASKKLRVLCLREIMESIADSSHKLLKDIISDNPSLSAHYTVTQNAIRGVNGTEFIFKGLRYNITEIKGTQGIDIAWVEEAANVSENSWQMLIPTIREEDSEIWVSFNPETEDSATYQRFISKPPLSALIMCVNYDQNPFFPKVLLEEMEYDRLNNYSKYLHIWEGELKVNTDAQVFKNYEVKEFEAPFGAEFIYGADWGFANDPTTLNRLFVIDKTIFIDYEAHGVHTEIDDLPELFKQVPLSERHIIRADSARPELISYMNRQGFRIVPASKGAGSIEDGVDNLRNYKIVIHPRCHHTAKEFSKYSYKVHRLTGDILPDLVDDWNHHIDGIRYGCEPLMKNNLNVWNKII